MARLCEKYFCINLLLRQFNSKLLYTEVPIGFHHKFEEKHMVNQLVVIRCSFIIALREEVGVTFDLVCEQEVYLGIFCKWLFEVNVKLNFLALYVLIHIN